MKALHVLRTYLRHRGGNAAVEFALVVPVFLTFMFGILETGLVFLGNHILVNAVQETGRLIRTGQVQDQGIDEIQFRGLVCDRISMLMTCDARLQIDVRRFEQFTGMNAPDAMNANGDWSENFMFDPGAAGDIVLVRVFYEWPLISPIMQEGMQDTPNGTKLLTASAAFRNEPFENILGED